MCLSYPTRRKPKTRKKPTHRCEFCGRQNRTVKRATDPYADEIRNDKTKHWICDQCEHDRNQDV